MRPIDSVTGKPWGEATANAQLQAFKKKIVRQLNRRDEIVSGGKLNSENEWSTLKLISDPDSPNPKWASDPVLSSMKSTGRDMKLLLRARWAEFCAEPRDEAAFSKQLDAITRSQLLTQQAGPAIGLEDELRSLGITSDVEDDDGQLCDDSPTEDAI